MGAADKLVCGSFFVWFVIQRGTALCIEILIWYSGSICGGKLKAI